jgi:hypothetical protein
MKIKRKREKESEENRKQDGKRKRKEKQRLSNTVFSMRLYKLSPCSVACVVWYSVIAERAVSQRE